MKVKIMVKNKKNGTKIMHCFDNFRDKYFRIDKYLSWRIAELLAAEVNFP